MTLKLCEVVWGDRIFNETDLVLTCVRDAIYMPFSPTIFFDRYSQWGVYSSDGIIVEEASYVRGPEQHLIGQSKKIDVSEICFDDDPIDEMVYGGPVISHFGHFIISSLARLWAINGRVPIVLHSTPPLDQVGSYQKVLLELSGITNMRSCSFERPRKIKRLFVPQSSLVEQFYISPYYFSAMQNFSRKIPRLNMFSKKKVYLSKSRHTAGVSRIVNEHEIETEFEKAGFLVVYPESLSVAEQIDLFRASSLIAGMASSAFHVLALSLESKAVRCIFVPDSAINSNYLLLDYGVEAPAFYYGLCEFLEKVDGPSNNNWRAKDAIALATAMVDAALSHVPSADR